ncbi:MAG: prephenate dehydrogenase [Hymenobacter sp.]|nr:prephenate dehydrogenase [Hymenobacter sp.]
MTTVTIIGIGLIGGSLALSLRQQGLATRFIGVEASPEHARRALELGLIDRIETDLAAAVAAADLVVVAVPMDVMLSVLPRVLDAATARQVVVDVGSTKGQLLAAVAGHPRRGRFVAIHPMAGTEYSGPEAAVQHLFAGKTVVVCDAHRSDPDAVAAVETLLQALPMRLLYLDAADHDLHTAYVSHISHITSFALALTVLKKEKEEQRIFDLASGGFESTVRLAKSSSATWVPIFRQNRTNVLDVLDEHLRQLQELRRQLADEDYEGLKQSIEQATEAGAMYITSRWLGGLLTNWEQVSRSLRRMIDIEKGLVEGKFDKYTKRERVLLDKQASRLKRFFDGIRDIKSKPDALFIIDPSREKNVVLEAMKMNVPIIGLVDSNTDPTDIDLPIPGNDVAVSSIEYITKAVLAGYKAGKSAK